MRIISVTAKNFLSFKELSYNFETHPVLIQGENLTEDSQESNGSGKSSLQSAVEYALFKTTVKPTDADLIFWGEGEASVTLVIDCPIRKQAIQIRRAIFLKGSSKLEIDINGQPQSFATVVDGNKFILEWVGISKEDLQNYYIINKERYKSFFSSSNKEKIEMINRFSNAKIIDGVDKFVQADVDLYDQDLKNYEKNKTSILATVRTLNDQVKYELNRDLKAELQEELQAIGGNIISEQENIGLNNESIQNERLKITMNNRKIQEKLTTISDKTKLISEVESGLKELEKCDFSKDFSSIKEELASLTSQRELSIKESDILRKNQREINSILTEIENNITGSVECPKCSHRFLVADPTIDIEEEKIAKVETSDLLEKTKKAVEANSIKLDKFDSEYSRVEGDKKELQKQEDEILKRKKKIKQDLEVIESDVFELNRDIKIIETSISLSDNRINRLTEYNFGISEKIIGLEKLISDAKELQIDQNRIGELKKQMKAEGEKLRNINYSIRKKKIQIFETSQWIFNFKKFNMFLANTSLKVIQGYCNKFLQDIKSDIQIKWEGIKMLTDGSLKEEITAYIIRDSRMRGFWTFSGGERARMDYSMILTLQRMINSTHKYGGLDFLAMDEIGEGMDALGLSDLMKSLSQLNKTIILTTHVTNRSIGGNVLLIKKENGVSKIA